MRNFKTLATYRIVPDGYGLNDKLSLNEVWMVDHEGKQQWLFGEQALVETITHEIMHERVKYLVKLGKMKPMSDPHGKPFRQMMAGLGITCNQLGQHTKSCDDPNSPVGVLLKDLGIPMMKEPITGGRVNWWISKDIRGGGPKGRSTLSKWECECIPPQKARIGKEDFFATCDICRRPFHKA